MMVRRLTFRRITIQRVFLALPATAPSLLDPSLQLTAKVLRVG
jgi:hypothetical protein